MSDFLQFVDRIPTLPNRKKLTFENDGSVKYAQVEYADEPIEEGTFLNKANFNRLNAVLGYNETSFTQSEIREEVDITISNSLNTNELYYDGNESRSISGSYAQIGRIYNVSKNFDSNVYAKGDSGTFYFRNTNYSNMGFLNSQSYSTTTFGAYKQASGYFHSVFIKFDIPIKVKDFTYYCSKTVSSSYPSYVAFYKNGIEVYKDNFYINSKQYNLDDYIEIDEIELYAYLSSKTTDTLNLYINNNIKFDSINYKNELVSSISTNFINNQIVKIETHNDLPISNVVSNSLDGIDVNTILQPSTRYELVYNEEINKFELGGVEPIFDITLTEKVNQVDTGLTMGNFEKGKIYAICFYGSTDNGTNIYLNEASTPNTITYGSTQYISLPYLFVKVNDNVINGLDFYNMTKRILTITFDNFIICTNSQYNFNVGTRIIIKEVA